MGHLSLKKVVHKVSRPVKKAHRETQKMTSKVMKEAFEKPLERVMKETTKPLGSDVKDPLQKAFSEIIRGCTSSDISNAREALTMDPDFLVGDKIRWDCLKR